MIKTVSLETAKLLKGNGWIGKSGLLWRYDTEIENGEFILNDDTSGDEEWYDAPTTDELLEELPWHTQIYKGTDGNLGQYICHLDARSVIGQKETKWFYHKDLCEALAQMWLYLKKKGLLNDNK